MKRYAAFGLALAGLFYCLPAAAQNSGAVPQYAVPIGKGAGTTGFDSAAPGTAGWALVSNGAGSKPTFQSVAGAAFGAQNANKVFAGPSSGADAVPTFRALVGADLPSPGASTLGGAKSLTASSNNFLTGLGTDGAFTRAQPSFSNLSGSIALSQIPAFSGLTAAAAASDTDTLPVTQGAGNLKQTFAAIKTWVKGWIAKADVGLGNVANVDTTNAANISSGTLPAARLPNPAASTLGGINSKDCSSGSQFVQTIGTDGSVTCATPAGSGGTGSSTSSFSAHKNGTDQTGITGDNSTYTQVTFGTEIWDTGSNFASSTWTPPAGKALINVQLYITGTFAVGNVFTGAIYKNGSLLKEGFVYATKANNTVVAVNVIVDCNGTDAFTVRVKGQADSGTLTVNGQSKWSFFTGSMI